MTQLNNNGLIVMMLSLVVVFVAMSMMFGRVEVASGFTNVIFMIILICAMLSV